jgi:hypothetical protein
MGRRGFRRGRAVDIESWNSVAAPPKIAQPSTARPGTAQPSPAKNSPSDPRIARSNIARRAHVGYPA